MNKIANIKQPAPLSLAANPNFVEFSNKYTKESGNKLVDSVLYIIGAAYVRESTESEIILRKRICDFSIQELKTKTVHKFKGTDFPSEVSADTFLINNETAKNIAACLSNNVFFKDRFDIKMEDNGIAIKSKGSGSDYAFIIIPEMEEYFYDFMKIEGDPSDTYDPDEDNRVHFSFTIGSRTNDESTELIFREYETQKDHIIKYTLDRKLVDNSTFFFNSNAEITAENLRMCLMKNSFFKENYNITISPDTADKIELISKGSGNKYTFEIMQCPASISTEGESLHTGENDSITRNFGECEIHLDIYKENDSLQVQTIDNQWRTYMTTLSKSYFGQPLWFDINTICSNQNKYSDKFLNTDTWCDAGTVSGFRFVAKRSDGVNNEPFFYSDAFYTLTGYARALEANDLSPYILDVSNLTDIETIIPLSNQPTLTHIENQKQYFNFILSDNKVNSDEECKISILYKVYAQSGSYLGKKMDEESVIAVENLNMVNTIALSIDKIAALFPKAGKVEAYLCCNGNIVSRPLTFMLQPSHLYKLNDFAFLNALGGWNSFNFGGSEQTDFKSGTTAIFKTHTPGLTSASSIETVFSKNTSEEFTVQTMPVKAEVAAWLKELGSSVAVYELATHRYIIVDELNIKHSDKDDLFTLQMKYHYSDAYNSK
ncbi:MAG: hypothetical protein E6767_12090 [Dysgonomonas sp.]|nr:hypothetical protein [Dysgonomonas sp.]